MDSNDSSTNLVIPKKRGRKPKDLSTKNESTINNVEDSTALSDKENIKENVVKEMKKRGRKPTCKVLNNTDIYNIKKEVIDDCLLLHLPLTASDIDKISSDTSIKSNLLDDILSDHANKIKNQTGIKFNLELNENNNINISNDSIKYNIIDKCNNCEILNNKISNLESKYHIYKITNTDKEIYNINLKLEDIYSGESVIDRSNDIHCWWCCHKFDTLPLGLPEKYYEKKFHTIGHFCSFNCSMAYDLSLNDHKIWDRISLLYYLRNMIFLHLYPNNDVKLLDDIITAPPRCMLKMFGGKLSIEEFREKSIVLKKQYRSIIPPSVSLTQQIEESTYNNDQNVLLKLPNRANNLNNLSNTLVLKRNKPLSSKTSLLKMMNIHSNEI
jgi:hypothetical protein